MTIIMKYMSKLPASVVGGFLGSVAAVFFMIPALFSALDSAFPVYSPVRNPVVYQQGNLVVFTGELDKLANCKVEHGPIGRVALHWNVGDSGTWRLVPLLNPDGTIRISSSVYDKNDNMYVEMAWDASRVAEREVVDKWEVRVPCRRYGGLHQTIATIGTWGNPD